MTRYLPSMRAEAPALMPILRSQHQAELLTLLLHPGWHSVMRRIATRPAQRTQSASHQLRDHCAASAIRPDRHLRLCRDEMRAPACRDMQPSVRRRRRTRPYDETSARQEASFASRVGSNQREQRTHFGWQELKSETESETHGELSTRPTWEPISQSHPATPGSTQQQPATNRVFHSKSLTHSENVLDQLGWQDSNPRPPVPKSAPPGRWT